MYICIMCELAYMYGEHILCSQRLLLMICAILGVSNIAMSFGGSWLEGDRRDINSWQNSLGSFNDDPKRIPKMMYDVMSTRGTCVATSLDVLY